MAVHTNTGRWDAGVAALFCTVMAIETRNLLLSGMQSMRIRNRLDRFVTLSIPGKIEASQ